jgi:hypothetical protein
MRTLRTLLPLLALLVAPLALTAQDEEIYLLSPFEVTSEDYEGYQSTDTLAGTRLRTDLRDIASPLSGYSSPPSVTLRKRADFITLRLHLVNDSRLSELRLTEIRATVRKMLERAAKDGRIALQYPRGTITMDNFHVNPEQWGNDTAAFDVFIAMPLGEKDSAEQLTEALIAFAKELEVEGRTLIEVGKPGLSIKNPERFRGELLAAIFSDLDAVRAAFGPDTRFTCNGLNLCMNVSAVSADEVKLVLPYEYTILSPGFRKE